MLSRVPDSVPPPDSVPSHSSAAFAGSNGGLSLAALADEDFRRQMQRGLAGFVRAVALEALNLGATVAAGAEVALAGESSASHTAGVKQALRQASDLLVPSADMHFILRLLLLGSDGRPKPHTQCCGMPCPCCAGRRAAAVHQRAQDSGLCGSHGDAHGAAGGAQYAGQGSCHGAQAQLLEGEDPLSGPAGSLFQ